MSCSCRRKLTITELAFCEEGIQRNRSGWYQVPGSKVIPCPLANAAPRKVMFSPSIKSIHRFRTELLNFSASLSEDTQCYQCSAMAKPYFRFFSDRLMRSCRLRDSPLPVQ